VEIILIGAQGSGKGTQSAMLAQALGVPHVASGDLFRKEIEEGTGIGLEAKKYIDRGELVPDDVTVAMILSRLREPDCDPGVLMDGFPRTIAQARALDQGLREFGKQINVVVYLHVPREELLQRLSGRYICKANQHVTTSILVHQKWQGYVIWMEANSTSGPTISEMLFNGAWTFSLTRLFASWIITVSRGK